jgi:hypothetical protein
LKMRLGPDSISNILERIEDGHLATAVRPHGWSGVRLMRVRSCSFVCPT